MEKAKPASSDGFTLVTYKNKKTRRYQTPVKYIDHQEGEGGKMFTLAQLSELQEELKKSEFLPKFFESLERALIKLGIITGIHEDDLPLAREFQQLCLNDPENADPMKYLNKLKHVDRSKFVDVVCWGLGRFRSCRTAQTQLALLMLMKKHLNHCMISVYDPVFNDKEKDFMKEIGLNVLNVNDKGRREIDHPTIFFMPHCDMPLYNNLLYANWKRENLSNLILIGNSFTTYVLNSTERTLIVDALYIFLATSFVEEIPIRNCFEHKEVFNDSSIHFFPDYQLSKVDVKLWDCHLIPPVMMDYEARVPPELRRYDD